VGVVCVAATRRSLLVDGLIACRRAHWRLDGLPDGPAHGEPLTPRCTVMLRRGAFEDPAVTSEIFPPGELGSASTMLTRCRASIGLCQLQADISATQARSNGRAVDRARAPRYCGGAAARDPKFGSSQCVPRLRARDRRSERGTAVFSVTSMVFADERPVPMISCGAAGLVAVRCMVIRPRPSRAFVPTLVSCRGGGTRHDPKASAV